MSTYKENIKLTITYGAKPKNGDIILWQNGDGKCELYTFHSDTPYGIKTYTDYNENDGSSLIVNWSGYRGVITTEALDK